MRRREVLALGAAAGVLGAAPAEAASKAKVYTSQKAKFRVVQLATGLTNPWGMAFLPTGELLVTDNGAGRLRVLSNGALEKKPIPLPAEVTANTGPLDVAVHPGFAGNKLIFLTFVGGSSDARTTCLARAVLNGRSLSGFEVIFRALPLTSDPGHHGNRIAIDAQGHVYIAVGDRNVPDRAQDLGDLAGKISRIKDDGSIPSDNPFVGTQGARPEIWTLGHRDPQGLAFRPGTSELWEAEHGPLGGDEVNLIRRGLNYGWPRATWGTDEDGSPIGDGPLGPGLTPPVYHWDKISANPPASIAPSGIGFYSGSRFPGWKGNLFVAALRGMRLIRLEIGAAGKVTHEEQLLKTTYGRLRHIRQGPDGLLYLFTDKDPGRILRLEPA